MSKSPPQGTHRVFGGVASMLRAGLVDALTEHKPLERRAPRQFNGPKPAKAGQTKGIDDAVVLHARWLHEFFGMTAKQIEAELALKDHHHSRDVVRNWLNYSNRASLTPEESKGPYL